MVEDEPAVAEVVGLYLRRTGYAVRVVADGPTALREIDQQPPTLIILDLMLPGVDGWAITRKVREGGDTPIIMLTARSTAGGIEVEVRDTGEGIRAEDRPYVFDRFYRGEKSRSRATGGAGLGLAIARGIVEAHGGSIRVESEAEQGARFVFVLPA